jgi:hypothetical protein
MLSGKSLYLSTYYSNGSFANGFYILCKSSSVFCMCVLVTGALLNGPSDFRMSFLLEKNEDELENGFAVTSHADELLQLRTN